MRNWKCLDCDYLWTSKKTIGKPSKCPNCDSVNIKIIPLTEEEIEDYATEISWCIEFPEEYGGNYEKFSNMVEESLPKIYKKLEKNELKRIYEDLIVEDEEEIEDEWSDLMQEDIDEYIKKIISHPKFKSKNFELGDSEEVMKFIQENLKEIAEDVDEEGLRIIAEDILEQGKRWRNC